MSLPDSKKSSSLPVVAEAPPCDNSKSEYIAGWQSAELKFLGQQVMEINDKLDAYMTSPPCLKPPLEFDSRLRDMEKDMTKVKTFGSIAILALGSWTTIKGWLIGK